MFTTELTKTLTPPSDPLYLLLGSLPDMQSHTLQEYTVVSMTTSYDVDNKRPNTYSCIAVISILEATFHDEYPLLVHLHVGHWSQEVKVRVLVDLLKKY